MCRRLLFPLLHAETISFFSYKKQGTSKQLQRRTPTAVRKCLPFRQFHAYFFVLFLDKSFACSLFFFFRSSLSFFVLRFFVLPFLLSSVPPFIRFPFLPFFRSFLRSSVPPFPSLLRSFVPSFLRSFVPSFLPSFLRFCLPSFLRFPVTLFLPSFLRSFLRSSVFAFGPSFLRSFVNSYLRFFALSFFRSFF